jgi:hypothetical protein
MADRLNPRLRENTYKQRNGVNFISPPIGQEMHSLDLKADDGAKRQRRTRIYEFTEKAKP